MRDNNDSDSDLIPFEDGLHKAGFGLYSYFLTFVCGFAIISYILVVYPSNIIVPSSACELNTTTGQQGIIAAGPVIGSIIGNLLWGYLADTRGRRKMLLVALTISALLNVLASLSVNWIMLLILQFIISIFASGVFPMSMTLLSECVPMAKRNFSVVVVMSMYFLSQSFLSALAIPIIPLTFSHHLPALGIYWNSWRTLLLVYTLPSIASALLFYLMNESPKYLFVNGEEEKAIRVLENIHKINNLRSENTFKVKGFLKDGTESNKVQLSTKEQFLPLFKTPLLKYTLTVIALMMLQQLGPFFIWLPTIANQFLETIQSGENMYQTVCGAISMELEAPDDPDSNPCLLQTTTLLIILCVGVINATANALVSMIVDAVGRRNLIIAICALCGACGILINLVSNAIASGVLFIVFLMGIVVIGLFAAIVVAIYPTHLRTFALAVPLACSTMADFASIQIMNLLLARNCEAGFYLFASLFTCVGIVALLLPDERRLLAKHQDQHNDQRSPNEISKKAIKQIAE